MEAAAKTGEGILSKDQTEKRQEIIAMLEHAYWMEIETVMSYIANSVNPDGVRAQEIKESLEEDIIEITEGVDHVTQDMVIDILHDEQGHRRLFEGFLREYEAEGLA